MTPAARNLLRRLATSTERLPRRIGRYAERDKPSGAVVVRRRKQTTVETEQEERP